MLLLNISRKIKSILQISPKRAGKKIKSGYHSVAAGTAGLGSASSLHHFTRSPIALIISI